MQDSALAMYCLTQPWLAHCETCGVRFDSSFHSLAQRKTVVLVCTPPRAAYTLHSSTLVRSSHRISKIVHHPLFFACFAHRIERWQLKHLNIPVIYIKNDALNPLPERRRAGTTTSVSAATTSFAPGLAQYFRRRSFASWPEVPINHVASSNQLAEFVVC